MTVTIQELPALGYVEIAVSGHVTRDDMLGVLPQLERFIAEHGKIRLVEIVKDFEGFDLGTIGPGVAFDFKHLRDISHAAIVTDSGWMGPISRLAGAVLPVEVRTFALAEVDAARSWAANPDA